MMWLYVIIAVIAVLLVVDIVTTIEIAKVTKKTKAAKSRQENKQAAKQEKTAPKQDAKAPVVVDTYVPSAEPDDEKEILIANDRFDEEKKEETVIVEEKVEEPKEEPEEKKPEPEKETKIVEKKPEPKKESKVVEKRPVEKKEAPKKEAPKKEEKEAPVKEKKEIPAPKALVKEEVAAAASVVKEEKKEKAKVTGKIEICNSDLGGYTYILRANNGQLLYESKSYKSVASCEDGAKSFIDAVKVGMFTVRADKFNRYKFILKSPTSNNIIYVGESFDNERSCQSNIESVRRFAGISEIVDITEADFKAKFTPYAISQEVKDKVKNNNGVVGKWAIEQEDNGSKNLPYVFLLYASNGQLLYESRDYSSYGSCKNGLETFRIAVSEGQFIIDPDKSGRYKFILRNASKNSSMEYIGQSYGTERACADGIDSIYRFALVSPTDKL